MATSRSVNLDLLRVLAAIYVLLYHFTHRYNEIFTGVISEDNIFSHGYLGVPAFFILSGYLVTKSYNKNRLLTRFYKSRLLRIYPTYIFSMSLTFLISSLLIFNERSISLIDYFINLFVFADYLGYKPADSAYWSLYIECAFYIVLPLIVSKKGIIFIVLVLLSFVNYFVDVYILNVLTLFNWISFFYIGYFLSLRKKNHYNIFFLLISLVNIFNYKGYEYFLTSIIIYMYMYSLPEIKVQNVRITKAISALAAISYPLYLLHQNIGYVILNYLRHIGISNFSVKCVITITTVLVLAYFINRLDMIVGVKLNKNK